MTARTYLPECAEHDRVPVTVMLTAEQADRLEAWFEQQQAAAWGVDYNACVDQVFVAGLELVTAWKPAAGDQA